MDPKKRLTADAAMKNTWINSFAAKIDNLSFVVTRIKWFNQRRREKANYPHGVLSVPRNLDRMLRVIEINESATEIKDPSPELNDDNSIEKSRSSK